jgi:hypothetical protein
MFQQEALRKVGLMVDVLAEAFKIAAYFKKLTGAVVILDEVRDKVFVILSYALVELDANKHITMRHRFVLTDSHAYQSTTSLIIGLDPFFADFTDACGAI